MYDHHHSKTQSALAIIVVLQLMQLTDRPLPLPSALVSALIGLFLFLGLSGFVFALFDILSYYAALSTTKDVTPPEKHKQN